MARSFPPGFIFGASTAAFQIEGAAHADGKGESMWDAFCRTPGKVSNGDTGDIACDHYHRFEEDLDLAAAAGMKAYRFSINWTRILPNGVGAANAQGLAFYDRLTDACLKRGIAPWPCFYHWDYSQRLHERGGWTHRESVDWYLELVQAVVPKLADRCGHWVMFNEPGIFTALGYLLGQHAPGVRDPAAYGAAVHHVNLATGEGVRLVRRLAPQATIGTVLAINGAEAATNTAEDHTAAERIDAIMNRAFLDPLFRAQYPDALTAMVAPFVRDGDMARCQVPLDFLGVNHYTRARVSAATGESRDGATAGGGMGMLRPPAGAPVTAMGWEIYPQGLYDVVARVTNEYGRIPIYITENGGAFPDIQDANGVIQDHDRIALLDGYLEALARACADGYDVRGYLVWSLLDNFEWAHGYDKRFGLVHVDYATLKRTPKASYHWYADLARTGKLPSTGS